MLLKAVLLTFVLTFEWLKPGVGKITETTNYDTVAQCEAAKVQKIEEKIGPDQPGGLVFSHTLHAECRER